MDIIEEELVYEEKMDEITIQLEELILDAMIAVLKKQEKGIMNLTAWNRERMII